MSGSAFVACVEPVEKILKRRESLERYTLWRYHLVYAPIADVQRPGNLQE